MGRTAGSACARAGLRAKLKRFFGSHWARNCSKSSLRPLMQACSCCASYVGRWLLAFATACEARRNLKLKRVLCQGLKGKLLRSELGL